jgi:predicted pyridoxine 5'-phosphate oxidase superfamily flavin-nucleotide-binding protein
LVLGHRPVGEDVLGLQLTPGRPVGLLGIEPSTRRRNRANGVVAPSSSLHDLKVQVTQSFGNCPKYIQARDVGWAEPVHPAGAPRAFGPQLPDEAQALVRAADTFFIATASSPAGAGSASDGVDVSHRGGLPGFVRIEELDGRTVLTIPDYSGNFFFNTLGNIAAHPHAGLLFIDWDRGNLWFLSGESEVVWDAAALAVFEGAQRLLRIRIRNGWLLPGALPLLAGEPVFAPQFQPAGDRP